MIRRTQPQRDTDGLFRGGGVHLVEAAIMEGRIFEQQQSDTRKRRLVMLGVIVFVGIVVVYLEAFRHRTQVKIVSVARNDPTIVNSSKRPNRYYLATTVCQNFEPGNFTSPTTVPWKKIGKELQRPIKEADMANQNGSSAHWANRFGYGTAVAMSGDGKRLAVAYEGTSGIDKAFGAHIDVYEFENKITHEYVLQQTLSDVTRFHGHEDHIVLFESVAMSRNGNRLAFSDGHGIHVYEFDQNYHNLKSSSKARGPWIKMEPEIDLKLKNSARSTNNLNAAGIQIAMNCDGTVVAVSGRLQKPGGVEVTFAHIFHLELRNDIHRVGYDWANLGEIHSIKHGGSIALDARGYRLAVGSVAYSMWRGAVQVYDYDEVLNEWHPIGDMLLGEKDMERSGGQVALNADGSVLVVSTVDGNNGHVVTYKFVQSNTTGAPAWEKLGQDLRGSGNIHEHFGADISLSDDGQVLAVGAPGDRGLFDASVRGSSSVSDENKKYFQGRICMYRMVSNEWVRIDNGELQLNVDGDMFGKSIALSSNGVWVFGGAPRRESNKFYQHMHGTTQVFRASL